MWGPVFASGMHFCPMSVTVNHSSSSIFVRVLAAYLFTTCSVTEIGTSDEAHLFWPSLQVTFLHEERRTESLKEIKREPNNTGRVQRRSAKVAIYYLHELAGEELAKEWPKRKVLQDLIPDDRKVQGLKNVI